MRKNILIAATAIAITASAAAEDWGEMVNIWWLNAPSSLYGYFNPSYCDADSTLYFDTFCRIAMGIEGNIYSTKLDSTHWDIWWWSDPVLLPEPINIEGYRSVMPCINPGGDTLLFSSDRPGTRGGLDIWMSVRNNNEWCEPINLGDSINTELAEMKPYYARNSDFLYFERVNPNLPYNWIRIYKSALANNTWQSGELLPAIINDPSFDTYGTFFDERENALYFTAGGYGYIKPLKKSVDLDGEWQTPQILGDDVNGFWYPNYCDAVETGDAWITDDGQRLFYDKWIWEASMCIDFYSYIFFSEKTVDIWEEENTGEQIENLVNIYPNPSNNAFYIELTGFADPLSLKIYNIMGQLVREFDPVDGRTSFRWDCKDANNLPVNSGVYFAVIDKGGGSYTKKLVLLK